MDDIFPDSSFLFRFRINNQPPLTTTSKCLGANQSTKSNKIKKKQTSPGTLGWHIFFGACLVFFFNTNPRGFLWSPVREKNPSCCRLRNFHPTLQFPQGFEKTQVVGFAMEKPGQTPVFGTSLKRAAVRCLFAPENGRFSIFAKLLGRTRDGTFFESLQ